MPKFTGDPDEAEADLRRASDALTRAEDELADAEARAEAIEQEPFDGSPEAEADISQRMEVVQREIESLQQDVAQAEDELHRTHDHWVYRGYLPS
jgi:F0F1-type ATP synthase membrane subunit b/b'